MNNIIRYLSFFFFLPLLSCGSGDDGSKVSVSEAAQYTIGEGYLIDSPVSGIAYLCSPSAKTGTTATDGKFLYTDGDTCTFSIGDISLPSATGSTIITVLDLASATKTTDTTAVNIAVFLQSLDDDGDISTAITITPERVTQLTGLSTTDIDFNSATFSSQLSEVISVTGVSLVTESEAITHLTNSLALIGNVDDTPGKLAEAVINIDGDIGDWAGTVPVMVDVAGDQKSGSNSSTDIISLNVVTDGAKIALLFQTTGAITPIHTPAAEWSHYEVGIHSFSGGNCEAETNLGFVIVNNFTNTNGGNFHRIESYPESGATIAHIDTVTAYKTNYLETSLPKTGVLSGTKSVRFNFYSQHSGTPYVILDEVAEGSLKCYTLVI